jgi:hypothetical protein
LVDRRIKDHESLQLVESTIQSCRDLSAREALEVVRGARQRVPGNERLLSLERRLVERLQQQTVEERRIDYLSRAREALRQSNFANAIHILQQCQADRIANSEVSALLEFARNEEKEQLLQEDLKAKLERAQTYIDNDELEAAIGFLSAELQQADAPALRVLLEEAMVARDAIRRQIEAALFSAGEIVREATPQDAIQYLRAQPNSILKRQEVQAAISVVQDQLNAESFATVGKAYAVMETDLRAADLLLKKAQSTAAGCPGMPAIASAFTAREQDVADRIIAETIVQCGKMPYIRDRAGVEALAQQVASVIDWASPASRSEWVNIQGKLSLRGIIKKLRA